MPNEVNQTSEKWVNFKIFSTNKSIHLPFGIAVLLQFAESTSLAIARWLHMQGDCSQGARTCLHSRYRWLSNSQWALTGRQAPPAKLSCWRGRVALTWKMFRGLRFANFYTSTDISNRGWTTTLGRFVCGRPSRYVSVRICLCWM